MQSPPTGLSLDMLDDSDSEQEHSSAQEDQDHKVAEEDQADIERDCEW